ncbi:hypothetical protein F5883DRAFT_440621 [Diaporthe sp. PMI_573]|nr:hypothetical protein F5883DRAFT_440621 [Diaporthaceae sp. PMI_573]
MANLRKDQIAPRTLPSSQGATSLVSTPTNACSAVARNQSPAAPISPPTDPRLRKQKRVNRVIRPEPGSLYDILYENQGQALFTLPIYWQDQHARLLGVQWNHLDTVRRPVPNLNSLSSKYPSRPTEVARDLTNDLITILEEGTGNLPLAALKKVLSTMFPNTLLKTQSNLRMNIRFGNAIFKSSVRVPLVWKRYNSHVSDSNFTKLRYSQDRVSSSSLQSASLSWTNQPLLGFINRTRLHQVRSTLYRPRPGPRKTANIPGDRLQKLLYKWVKPQNADKDSYLVATMLAIAQWQCSSSLSRSSPRSSAQASPLPQPEVRGIPVKIITQDHEKAEFIIYSTVVTAAFLNRFAFPSKAPAVTDMQGRGLNINLTRVQIWPVLGLKERLAKALGPEIAGDLACHDIADSNIETWETEEERAIRLRNLKRKKSTDGKLLTIDLSKGLFTSVVSSSDPGITTKRRRTRSAVRTK